MRTIPVIVVIQPDVLLLDVAGPVEALRAANINQSDVQFDLRFVGPMESCMSSIGLAVSGIEPLPNNLPAGALVVVSGSADEPLGVRSPGRAAGEAAIVDWLRRMIHPGIRLVTICSGSVLAGAAGLFDGYACTTHHESMDDLRKAAPLANVLSNRLYVEDGERLSSAGITAGIDLMLNLVAKDVSPACAVSVARYMVVYVRRGGGDPQLSPWLEGRNHIHPAIHRVQDLIAADPARDWFVADLAREAGASPRNLSRLFNEHAGMSVTDYVNRMRVTLAADMLKSSRLDIETVAERSGFGSPRQLRRAWGRYHELPPSRMRG